MEFTVALLKPDCIQKRLLGEVIRRFEERASRLITAKRFRSVTVAVGITNRVTKIETSVRFLVPSPAAKGVTPVKALLLISAAVLGAHFGVLAAEPVADPREHWAFKPPIRPTIPVITPHDSRITSPIDALIFA